MGGSTQNKKGYVTLLSVLLIGAVGTTVAVSLLLLSVNYTRTNLVFEKGAEARALTSACAEEALQKVRETDVIKGTFTLEVDEFTCTYTISGSGAKKTITISGSIEEIVKRLEITTRAVSPKIEIELWREVGDF